MANVVKKHSISSELAQKMVDEAMAKAKKIGVLENVAILDDGGNLKAFGRMDGAPTRHGIRVNGYLSWRISSRNLGSQPALLRRVLTLPFRLLARTSPRAKRRTMAMFLAPCPVR